MNKRFFYNELYSNNVYVIKKFRSKYKLILFKALRNSGVEFTGTLKNKNSTSEKLQNNLSRAKSTIYELAICNNWEYFVTLTISSTKYDRENLKVYYKDFSKFINNYNYQNNYNIKYLFIPELHSDKKSWHIHGLIYNLPNEKLSINSNGYLNWEDYSSKFGYMSLSKIRDIEKTALYITKYITKDTEKTKIDLNNHLFYCSQGLKRAEKLFKGHIYGISPNFEYDFKNDYLSIKNLSEDKLENILNECELVKI